MAISEWDRRQLCPDGACVGVIGPDGTCKVCGRVAPDWGDERRRGLVAADNEGGDQDDGGSDGDGGGEQDEISPSAPAVLGEMAVWQRRRLCPDGACVGVIGPDGTCKVCGKAATAGEEEEEVDAGEDAEDDEDDVDDEDEGDGEDESAAEEDEEDEDEDEDDEDEEDEDAEDAEDAEEGAAGDLDDRKLCPDGACIGVIGPDGRCKVCGKEAA